MVHLSGVSAGELPPAAVTLQLAWLPVAPPLHCGLHGCFQPADGRVHVHPGPGGRSHPGRVRSSRGPLGGGSWLPGDRMGLGVRLRGERSAADSGGRAVRRERDVRPRVREVAVPWECAYMCTFLPHPFPHPRVSAAARSRGVWVLTFLPSLASASSSLSASVLAGFPLGAHYDEHPVLADRHRFIHPALLGATEGRV